MAARPARRPSKLAGEHPAYPVAPGEPGPPAEHGAARARAAVVPAGREKLTVTLSREVVEDAKNAWWAAMQAGRHIKFAHLIEAALAAYTDQLRSDLNNGQPFPSRPEGAIQPGRPVS